MGVIVVFLNVKRIKLRKYLCTKGNGFFPLQSSVAFSEVAQQSVHRTAGGLRVLGLIQARNLVPFRELVLPAAGNAGRWAARRTYKVAK